MAFLTTGSELLSVPAAWREGSILYLNVIYQSGWSKVWGKMLVSVKTVPTYSWAFPSPLNSSQNTPDKEAAFCCCAAFGLAVASVDLETTKEAPSVASTHPQNCTEIPCLQDLVVNKGALQAHPN